MRAFLTLTVVVALTGVGLANGRAGAVASARDTSSDICQRARNDPASASRSPAMRPYLAARDAIWYNHPDELTGLIEACLNIDSQNEYGWTLLHYAVDRDRVALAKILLENRASKAIRNKDGQTASDLATSAEMKALLGRSESPVARPALNSSRNTECQQKYRADAALCSDSTCRMRSMRKWQQCLKTGAYW